jgi:hypothetical protein
MEHLTNLFTSEKLSANQIITWFMRERMHTNQSSKLFPNTYLGNWEADVFEVTKSGYLYEYEVKITRADFKKDAEKCRKRMVLFVRILPNSISFVKVNA